MRANPKYSYWQQLVKRKICSLLRNRKSAKGTEAKADTKWRNRVEHALHEGEGEVGGALGLGGLASPVSVKSLTSPDTHEHRLMQLEWERSNRLAREMAGEEGRVIAADTESEDDEEDYEASFLDRKRLNSMTGADGELGSQLNPSDSPSAPGTASKGPRPPLVRAVTK